MKFVASFRQSLDVLAQATAIATRDEEAEAAN